jgi:penicillin-binding protein 1A
MMHVASVFTPEELLRIYAHELYLGKVDGRAVLGADAASRVYFGKETRNLTIAEAAMLAAMIRSPHTFSPVRSPARAMERRNWVLERMLRLDLIEDREFRAAVAEPLRTTGMRPATAPEGSNDLLGAVHRPFQ